MPEEAKRHHHRCDPTGVYGRTIYGQRLVVGDTLQVTDVYDSTSGEWQPCPCPGVPLTATGDTVTWVRICAEPRAANPEPSGTTNHELCEVDPFI